MKDNKCKRILALIGVILLTGMYLMTLVFAFVDPTAGKLWLKASIVCTIFVPGFHLRLHHAGPVSEKVKSRKRPARCSVRAFTFTEMYSVLLSPAHKTRSG